MESLAQLLDNDREWATRLQVQDEAEKSLPSQGFISRAAHEAKPVGKATVVPTLYPQLDNYYQSWRGHGVDTHVLQIVAASLPMPQDDEALERIIHLRQRDSFKAFMPAFRAWHEQVALKLLKAGSDQGIRKREIRVATRELKDSIAAFEKEMKKAKLTRSINLPLTIGAALVGDVKPLITALAEIGNGFFGVHELKQAWWRGLAEKEFAFAGVICEAARR